MRKAALSGLLLNRVTVGIDTLFGFVSVAGFGIVWAFCEVDETVSAIGNLNLGYNYRC